MAKPVTHVVAGALHLGDQLLLARRPDEKHQGALWELPGGKLEPGEDRQTGLKRELFEELGITVTGARPQIRLLHHYDDLSVDLDVWRITGWNGQPTGCEGQPLQWVSLGRLSTIAMPAADRAVVTALRLPAICAITPDCADARKIERSVRKYLSSGIRLVQLRAPQLSASEVAGLAEQLLPEAKRQGSQISINEQVELARQFKLPLHLKSNQIKDFQRPAEVPVLGASCHTAEELEDAAAIGADYAFLSPVKATPSHPGAEPLGWKRFTELVSESVIPVYALGGVGRDDVEQAWRHGAQGVAGIRGI